MISVLVHLWCVPGQEKAFRAYEDAALEIFAHHGGEVLERLHPDAALSTAPVPHEIHRLRIASLKNFDAFRADTALQALASQRAACVEKTQVFICPAPEFYD